MKDEDRYVTMLEEHDIKPTANRLIVLRTLDGAGRPMSLSELEYKILSIDKSGIFRTLSLFREQHLVHVIEDGHFYCEQCHQTYCLDHIPVPDIELPEGFVMESVNYMVKGICPHCAYKAHRA